MNKFLKLTAVVLLGLLTTTVAYGAMGSYWKTISDLIPRTDMAVDIGDATHYVGNLYVSTSTMNSLTVNDFFTLGGTVGVGGIDMANYLITNIGNASTDFTSGGGLNLAGALSVTGTSTLGITTITNLTLGSVSNTEFGYLDGITSAIQTQLGLKAPLASPTFTGNVTMPGTGIWNSSGNVGIGTTSPSAKLDVWGNLNVGTSSTPALYVDTATGYVGIGTGVPTSTLDIYDSSGAQLTLTQTNGTNYAQFKVDSVGDLRITAEEGDDIKMADDNLWICSGGSINTLSCPSLSLSTNGNLIVENDIYVDDSGTNHSEYKKICPDGYIWVSGNSKLGTESGFCVMKYEAKCDDDSDGVGDTTAESANYGVWDNSSTACTGAGKDVVSSAQGAPITYISQVNAQAYCEAIGEGYHLITDQEWMTIAEDAGWQDENWCDLDGSNCGNTPGTNYLAAGHNDNAPSEAEDATTSDSYPCYATVAEDTNATCGDAGSQKRTHTLSNGEVIWDVAGNVYEWTDNYIVHETGTAHTDGEMPLNDTAATTSNWYEYTNVTNYKSVSYIKPFRSDWSSTQRIGKIYLDYNGAYTTGDDQSDYHAFSRGGNWGNTSHAGVWTLILAYSPALVTYDVGLRCAR